MPKPADRNRKRRKVAVKLPGGKTVIRFLARKPRKAKCAVTGEELHGIPRVSPVQMKRLPKTAKRPERPYGGTLSSRAMRDKLKIEARMSLGDDKVTGNVVEVGRVCVKIAGRDAGLNCVIVDIIDSNFVMVDGQTRRRKCNINHLEPINKVIKIKKAATTADVKKGFTKLGFEMSTTKPKKATSRDKKVKVSKKQSKSVKVAKETPKKETINPKVEKKAKKPAVKKSLVKKPAAKKK